MRDRYFGFYGNLVKLGVVYAGIYFVVMALMGWVAR
jgi:hypothetical protein